MEIKQRIEAEFKQALKNKDGITVSTLRMLKSALHNREIEKKGEELSEAEIVKVIVKQIKQHEDSIEQFKKGQRQELAEKETKELEILKKYLPEQLSEQEIVELVKRIIAETGAKGKSDFGKVMKSVMVEVKGGADGKLINQIVSAQLGS